MTSSMPAWFYGPNGEARIFQPGEEVPAGWADDPAKAGTISPIDRDGDGAEGGSLPGENRKARKQNHDARLELGNNKEGGI